MKIRKYTDADLASVAHLFTASIHALTVEHYDATQRAAWAPRVSDLGQWRLRLQTLTTLVAETDGVLAGFIAYSADGHVDLLYTLPRFARQGVASMLYREAESALRQVGANVAFTEASLVARPFFERHGFVVAEERSVTRRGQVFRRFGMSKTLLVSAAIS